MTCALMETPAVVEEQRATGQATDLHAQPMTLDEVAVFAGKLEAWSRALSPRERAFLNQIIVFFAASPEPGGGFAG